MTESNVDTEITCPACRKRVPKPAADGVVACPHCSASFVPSGSESATVQLDSRGGTAEGGSVQLPPEFLARYALGNVLGRGGMGTVFLAQDLKSGQDVAVKVLTQIESGPMLTRFLQEGKLALEIDHPNVMKVHEVAEIGGHPYLVSEVLPGGSLRTRIKESSGPMPLADCLRITLDVLAGLSAVHSRGIIHRDIKPDNVLFAADGSAKLVDFGIAKDQSASHRMTKTGELLGTPQYMAPEQIRGHRVTRSTDLYSVGVIFYEMLTGRPPFIAKDFFELMMQHVSGRHPAVDQLVPGMPEEACHIVSRALAKEPGKRPADAEQMAMALRLCPRELRSVPASRTGIPLDSATTAPTGDGPPSTIATPIDDFVPPPDRKPLIMIAALLCAMGMAGFCTHLTRVLTAPRAPATPAASASAPPRNASASPVPSPH